MRPDPPTPPPTPRPYPTPDNTFQLTRAELEHILNLLTLLTTSNR